MNVIAEMNIKPTRGGKVFAPNMDHRTDSDSLGS